MRAAVTVIAVEVAAWVWFAAGGHWAHAGWVPLTPTVAAGVVAMWAWRNLNTPDGAPKVAYAVAAFCVSVLCAATLYIGPTVTIGIVLSAAGEEAVFRVALPAVVAAGLARVGVRAPLAHLGAFAAAAAVFAYMPGHIAQAGATGQLPWFALATMWTLMLRWRMPLWVPWLSHAAMNAAAAVMLAGGSSLWWPITLFMPMIALVAHARCNDHGNEAEAIEPAAAGT